MRLAGCQKHPLKLHLLEHSKRSSSALLQKQLLGSSCCLLLQLQRLEQRDRRPAKVAICSDRQRVQFCTNQLFELSQAKCRSLWLGRRACTCCCSAYCISRTSDAKHSRTRLTGVRTQRLLHKLSELLSRLQILRLQLLDELAVLDCCAADSHFPDHDA